MKRIEDIDKSTPDLPLARSQLRRVLLASKQFEGQTFSFMKKLLPVGLALVLLLMFNAVQKPDSTLDLTPTVSAKELVNEVLENLQNLTTDQLTQISQDMGLPSSDEIITSLTDAVNAPDLSYVDREVLSCDEALTLSDAGSLPTVSAFVVSSNGEISSSECVSAFILHAKPDDKYPAGYSQLYLLGSPELELTYLQYTNELGAHVLLGLTEDLLPYETINLSSFDNFNTAYPVDQSEETGTSVEGD